MIPFKKTVCYLYFVIKEQGGIIIMTKNIFRSILPYLLVGAVLVSTFILLLIPSAGAGVVTM